MERKDQNYITSENANNRSKSNSIDRRTFLNASALGIASVGLAQIGCSIKNEENQEDVEKPKIQGFEETSEVIDPYKGWAPVSDRRIRVGIVGYGLSKFGAQFGFQDHPNVEIIAVSDLIPERCNELAVACNCSTTYPSLEELVNDNNIEAVFVATDAPSHMRHCLEVLKHGKHVACAVPAVFGSLEDADRLFDAVKKSGLKYMLFETSAYRASLHAMREIYNANGLGELVYAEGEYYHYMDQPLDSYLGWRIGLPPQYYPTHSNAFHTCVTGGSFTEVSCMGMPSVIEHLKPQNNVYKNKFGTEIALFRTSEGGTARMAVSWDTPGDHGERGRVRGQKGTYYDKFEGLEDLAINVNRPPLPPGMPLGGHGGSHGYLTNEFINAILEDRNPLVDIAMALNLTVSGIVAHLSAEKDAELMKIPQYGY